LYFVGMNSTITDHDHVITIDLGATPAVVYAAISTPAGIRHWWTSGAEGDSEEGGTIRVTFREDHWTELLLEALDPGREVRWRCTAQQEDGFGQPDEWVGTTMSFLLEPAGGDRTRLRFVHHGLRALDCVDMCTGGWNFYVGQSLRRLVETGQGLPDTPRGERADA
jgi:uncharacterized protein YndB with AHSA1/START domain